MLGLNSLVRYHGDREIKGTIIGETIDKWVVEWWNPYWTSSFSHRVNKDSGLQEVMMYDTPVKRIGDRLVLDESFSS